jgi:hypothetical protein
MRRPALITSPVRSLTAHPTLSGCLRDYTHMPSTFGNWTARKTDDALSSFGARAKALNEMEGNVKGIAHDCQTDIVNTYRIWLCYELFGTADGANRATG